jgi:hypothetical protein
LTGLIIFILALIQGTLGCFRPHVPEEGEKKSQIRFTWEIAHKGLGFSLLGLSWYQVQSGIKIYSSFFETSVDMLAVFWGVAAGIAGLVALGFIKIQIFDKKDDEPAGNGSKEPSQTDCVEAAIEDDKNNASTA